MTSQRTCAWEATGVLAKNCFRGTNFRMRSIYIISVTRHDLLLYGVTLWCTYFNNGNVYSLDLLRNRDRLSPHSQISATPFVDYRSSHIQRALVE